MMLEKLLDWFTELPDQVSADPEAQNNLPDQLSGDPAQPGRGSNTRVPAPSDLAEFLPLHRYVEDQLAKVEDIERELEQDRPRRPRR